MSKIVIYDTKQVRQLAERVLDSYNKNVTQTLTFEDWKCSALPVLLNQPGKFDVTPIDFSKPIRVCPPVSEMLAAIEANQQEINYINANAKIEERAYKITQLLKQIIKPAYVIDQPQGIFIEGMSKKGPVKVPIWFNQSTKGVSLRMGFANMDSATPGNMRLGDVCVHAMLGGATGAGKSVTINSLISTAMLEYPPWELELYLMDMKVVELRRYGSTVHAPGVKIVGATGSTVFVMSMLTYLAKEMMDRQRLFAACGVQNIKDFRKNFDMVLPRGLLLVDEFVQLFDNLNIAAQEGCTDTDEQKELINSSISKLARLGRNAGLHMLLSSQNLNGTIDEQVSGQFSAGATVRADGPVSTALIGNDAGVRIRGHGKGIYNTNRLAKDPKDNVNVRIPFIQADLSPEEEAAGKQTYLTELLIALRKKADELGLPDNLYLYNEDADIPYEEFATDLVTATNREISPNTGKEITDSIFKSEITKVFVIGHPVKYAPGEISTIDLKMRRNHSIIVGADNINERVYMLRLLVENLKLRPFEHYVVIGDKAIYQLIEIDKDLDRVKLVRQKTLPAEAFGKYTNRLQILSSWSILEDAELNTWDSGLILRTEMGKVGMPFEAEMAGLLDKLISGEIDTEGLQAAMKQFGVDDYKWPRALQAFSISFKTFHALKKLTNDFTTAVTANSFERIFVWFLGLDEHDDIGGSEVGKMYGELIGSGPTVGIHSIITAEHWSKAGRYAENCNFIMERCNKTFFNECGLKVRVNTAEKSFQMFDQQLGSSEIIKKYLIQ